MSPYHSGTRMWNNVISHDDEVSPFLWFENSPYEQKEFFHRNYP